jgi:CheY-like chemotaxis protein
VSNVALAPHGADLDLDGDFVAVAVKDDGAGIPEHHMRHIFEPFYTTKPVGRGTGLGLSQVYGFARQSGGAITVASRPGDGALFTLYLPRGAEVPAAPAARPEARPPLESDEGRLLLVEDDPDVGASLEALLAGAGYEVAHAVSAEAALARIEAQDFDVVLSDILLGGPLSGYDLAVRLKHDMPGLPVVLMSGYAECVSEVPLDQAVLIKPFGPDVLLPALRRARAQGARVPA